MLSSSETLFFSYLDDKVIRIKLPVNSSLGSVNAYAFDNGNSWTLLDCGYDTAEHRNIMKAFFKEHVSPKKPLKQLIVSHFHPDHIGLSAWLSHKNSCDFLMNEAEYTAVEWLRKGYGENEQVLFYDYYIKNGFSAKQAKNSTRFFKKFGQGLSGVPECTSFLSHGDKIMLARTEWTILCAGGHSPSQLCFHSQKYNILITIDVLLQKTTPNISVWPNNPHKNPLMDYLKSHVLLQRHINSRTTIYPGHGEPFSEAIPRINAIQVHHQNRRNKIIQTIRQKGPQSLAQLLPSIYSKVLSNSDYPFAIGELHAHLNFLQAQKKVEFFKPKPESAIQYRLR